MEKEILPEEKKELTLSEWIRQYEKILYLKVRDDDRPDDKELKSYFDQKLTPLQAFNLLK